MEENAQVPEGLTECPECGAAVFDASKHKEWHRKNGSGAMRTALQGIR